MANQMIALQTRGAKLPDPAAQTAKFVSMMNMTKQQEAAERQAALAQQSMVLAQKKDAREEALQGPAVTKAEVDNIRAQIDDLEEQYKMVSTEEGHQFWLGRVRKIDPVIADQIGMYAPNFDQEKVNNIMLTAKQAVDKIDPDAKSTVEYAARGGVDEQGRAIPEGTAIQVTTGSKPSTRVIPSASAPVPAAAPKTPVAPPAAPQMPTGDGGQLDAFQQDHVRRMKEGLGMTDTPASFNSGSMSTPTAGQMSPDMVPAILDSAVNTGVMAQIDLDQMIALAPPQARDGIMKVIRNNNISLQADAPSLAASGMGQQQPMAPNPVQRPQSQFADMRGPAPQASFADLGAQPPMQNTMAQYQPLQRRDPNVSPTPGIYGVPTGQVAATSQAQRASPAETAANEAAKIGVQTKAKIAEEDRLKAKGRKLFSSVLNDLRNDYQKLNSMEAIPSIERGGFENVGDYIGASRVGRMAQSAVGARASVPLNTISNSKLTLMNALKEATGLSATQLSSNIELMTFLNSLADPTQGFESAMETIRRLDNLYGAPRTAAPAAAPRAAPKTPVIPDAAKQMLRKNPSPQQRAFFDRTFGKGAAAKVMGNR